MGFGLRGFVGDRVGELQFGKHLLAMGPTGMQDKQAMEGATRALEKAGTIDLGATVDAAHGHLQLGPWQSGDTLQLLHGTHLLGLDDVPGSVRVQHLDPTHAVLHIDTQFPMAGRTRIALDMRQIDEDHVRVESTITPQRSLPGMEALLHSTIAARLERTDPERIVARPVSEGAAPITWDVMPDSSIRVGLTYGGEQQTILAGRG